MCLLACWIAFGPEVCGHRLAETNAPLVFWRPLPWEHDIGAVHHYVIPTPRNPKSSKPLNPEPLHPTSPKQPSAKGTPTVTAAEVRFLTVSQGLGLQGGLLKGSWDLVTRVIIKATILIITYSPN